jgi:acid phosphatase (class A)
MAAIAAWKFLIPIGGAAVIGILVARPNAFPRQLLTPPAVHHSAILGYLSSQELPDSIALLPPPPQEGSAAMKRDTDARTAALALRGSPRYVLATADANRGQPNTTAAFQCAFGTEISPARTPVLYELLGRVRLDVRAASYAAKSRFVRPRPFVANRAQVCFAPDQQNVRNDGSYPSSRGAVGFAYAHILAELNPARATEIAKRADEFGKSRVICDEEWLSDIDAGRAVAEATLRHIEQKPAFHADFDAARKETAAGLRSGVKPPNCPSETLALAGR